LVALLSKKTSVVMVPIWALALLLYLRRCQIGRRIVAYGSGLLILATLAGVACLATETGQSFREWLVYDYLFLPSERFPFEVRRNYLAPEAVTLYRYYLANLFTTFWGDFGWMKVRLSASWYKLLAGVSLLAMIGLGRIVWRARRSSSIPLKPWQWQVLLLFAAAIPMMTILVFVTLIRKWDLGDPLGPPQGRYFFPLIIPLATLFVLGIWEWFPSRYRWFCPVIILGGLLLLDTLSLVSYVLPYFYG
jgi:hypothetical protein